MAKGNLLIVDDEELLQTLLQLTLQDSADAIHLADNGLIALEFLERHDIHCILCDIRMPKMSGVQFLNVLRERNINIPTVFYSGYGSHELMAEVALGGAYDFLMKPKLEGIKEIISNGLKVGMKTPLGPADQQFKTEFQRLFGGLKAS